MSWARFILFLVALLVPACSPPEVEEAKAFGGSTMGTTWWITFAEAPPDGLKAEVQAVLDGLEAKLSHWDEGSEVSRFNAACQDGSASVEASPELLEVVAYGIEVSRQTGGAFNIALGRQVAALGFGPAHLAASPGTARPAHEVLEISGGVLRGTGLGLALDLSALAKGYAVDRVAGFLQAEGIGDFLIEIGGELRSLGRPEAGVAWRIGLQKPAPRPAQIGRVLELPPGGRAVATSGNYQLFKGGSPSQSHLVSEFPETGFRSVSVFAPTCMEADAWATALFVLPREEAEELGEELGLKVVFLPAP